MDSGVGAGVCHFPSLKTEERSRDCSKQREVTISKDLSYALKLPLSPPKFCTNSQGHTSRARGALEQRLET